MYVISEKWLSALCVTGLGGAGVVAWLEGQRSAGYLFFALAGLILLVFAYQAYRQRTTPAGGPPDPSVQWSGNFGADHNDRTVTFRYSKATLVLMRCIVFLSALSGPAIYFLSSPRPAGNDLAALGAFEVLLVLAFYGAYRACATYWIEVAPDIIRVNGLFRQRAFPFSSLGKVALLEGGGRGPRYVVALYDRQEKPVRKLSSEVAGFEEMVALIRERAFAAGTPYCYRDKWGCWTT